MVALSPQSLSTKRSEEHTSELQSRGHLVCRLLLEKKKIIFYLNIPTLLNIQLRNLVLRATINHGYRTFFKQSIEIVLQLSKSLRLHVYYFIHTANPAIDTLSLHVALPI